MPVSRFLVFSSKNCARAAAALLQRFGPSKRIQSRGYVKSSKPGYGKLDGDPVMPMEPQTSRSWGTYAIPAAVLGFVGIATLVHYNDERRAVLKGQGDHSGISTVKGPINGGSFTLVDMDNRIVTEKNFLGKWLLLYFGYTSSPDVGPEQLQIMAKAVDKLESKQGTKVLPVFVSIDPQRDTPAQLRAYLREFDSRIVGLTGPVNAIRQMAQEYRIYFKKVEDEGDDYLVESSHNMYLINPKMEVVRCFGIEYTAEELSEAIFKEVNGNPP